MRKVRFRLGERSYAAFVGNGASRLAGRWMAAQGYSRKALLVTTPPIRKLFGAGVVRSLESAGFKVRVATVPDGEASKSLAAANKLYGECIAAGLDRWSPIIALGGGVTGDLAGFVAATFLRGVPFVQVPTTLLAQVDSSIGGKTGVDLPQGKNLIGSFYQPRAVFADTAFLKTLPPREVGNGLAEMIKHGVALDARLFAFLEKNISRILSLDQKALEEAVAWNMRIKGAIVERDEQERGGTRRLVNFGHTLGHAVEAVSGYSLSHGECVAIGMAGECALSQKLVGMPPRDAERVNSLIRRAGLPVKIPHGVPTAKVLETIGLDKKARAGKINTVLLKRIGKAVIRPVPASAFAPALQAVTG